MLKKFLFNSLLNLRKLFFKTLFPFWQSIGIHMTPVHFYEPVPDTRELKNNIWKKQSELLGIDINLKKQLKLLTRFQKLYEKEYSKIPVIKTSTESEYFINNGGFETVDGEMLYCMIRYFRPKNIIEIGSGHSTLLIQQAISENEKDSNPVNFTLIDPYPNKHFVKNFKKKNSFIQKKVEDMPFENFMVLSNNDILFIDSTHVLKIGGDVWYEINEILPRLKKGVIIHFHDIFLPAHYPKRQVLKDYYFWNEQYLLQSFLTFNNYYEILLMASQLHLKYPTKLKSIFPSYDPKIAWPASFWIKKIR